MPLDATEGVAEHSFSTCMPQLQLLCSKAALVHNVLPRRVFFCWFKVQINVKYFT